MSKKLKFQLVPGRVLQHTPESKKDDKRPGGFYYRYNPDEKAPIVVELEPQEGERLKRLGVLIDCPQHLEVSPPSGNIGTGSFTNRASLDSSKPMPSSQADSDKDELIATMELKMAELAAQLAAATAALSAQNDVEIVDAHIDDEAQLAAEMEAAVAAARRESESPPAKASRGRK